MNLRSPRERVLQTLSFEAGGILLAAPLYAAVIESGNTGAFAMVAALSVAVMIWSPIHNTIFDWADFAVSARLASDRPHALRLVHAASHEASAVLLTCPLAMVIGNHSLREALAVNVLLTIFYTLYAYVFHFAYDRMRPVATNKKALAEDAPSRRDRDVVAQSPPLLSRSGSRCGVLSSDLPADTRRRLDLSSSDGTPVATLAVHG